MACDPNALSVLSAPFSTLNEEEIQLTQIGLLMSLVLAANPGANVTPKALLALAACFASPCVSEEGRELAKLGLLCLLTP